MQLFDGHSYVGVVAYKQYYGFDLDPGTHLLWSTSAPPSRKPYWWLAPDCFLRAGVKAGKTYYVHLRFRIRSAIAPFGGETGPELDSAGPKTTTGKTSLKKINKRLTKDWFVFEDPATAEHIETMQEELGPMIEKVMAEWDRRSGHAWVLHEADYVK